MVHYIHWQPQHRTAESEHTEEKLIMLGREQQVRISIVNQNTSHCLIISIAY